MVSILPIITFSCLYLGGGTAPRIHLTSRQCPKSCRPDAANWLVVVQTGEVGVEQMSVRAKPAHQRRRHRGHPQVWWAPARAGTWMKVQSFCAYSVHTTRHETGQGPPLCVSSPPGAGAGAGVFYYQQQAAATRHHQLGRSQPGSLTISPPPWSSQTDSGCRCGSSQSFHGFDACFDLLKPPTPRLIWALVSCEPLKLARAQPWGEDTTLPPPRPPCSRGQSSQVSDLHQEQKNDPFQAHTPHQAHHARTGIPLFPSPRCLGGGRGRKAQAHEIGTVWRD